LNTAVLRNPQIRASWETWCGELKPIRLLMFALVMAIVALASAVIFLAHAIEAYRV
jgi:hypothetical protein